MNKTCLVIFIIFSFTRVKGSNQLDSLYKVTKIKDTENYYIIRAQRNDSLFKIISKKVSLIDSMSFRKIEKGGRYHFDFGDREHATGGETEPIAGIASYLHVKKNTVFEDGNTRIKFTKRFHYRIYKTKNLIGLYYSPSVRW